MVLSISVQEEAPAIANFINRYDLSYPFAMDADGSTSQNYKVFSTPTTYFVNPDGVITDILPGLMTQQWITANIESIKG